VDQFLSGQMIEHVALNRVTYFRWLARLRDQIKPAPRRNVPFAAGAEDVSGYGIAAAKTVKQPAVKVRFFQSLLYSFDQDDLRKLSILDFGFRISDYWKPFCRRVLILTFRLNQNLKSKIE